MLCYKYCFHTVWRVSLAKWVPNRRNRQRMRGF